MDTFIGVATLLIMAVGMCIAGFCAYIQYQQHQLQVQDRGVKQDATEPPDSVD